MVFHQGDPGNTFHVIESGWFLVHVLTPDGDRVGMTIEGPGDVFGELALLQPGGVRSATVKALRAAVTLSLDVDQFAQLRSRQPEIDRFLVALLASRVDRLTNQLAETAWMAADKRVCRQLQRLSAVFDGGPILLRQAEIASLVQTTRPTVSSVLGQLKDDGIVETGRGYVVVVDPDGLRRRAQ